MPFPVPPAIRSPPCAARYRSARVAIIIKYIACACAAAKSARFKNYSMTLEFAFPGNAFSIHTHTHTRTRSHNVKHRAIYLCCCCVFVFAHKSKMRKNLYVVRNGNTRLGRGGRVSARLAGNKAGIYFLLPSFRGLSSPRHATSLANPRPIIIINSQQNGPNLNVECQTAAGGAGAAAATSSRT